MATADKYKDQERSLQLQLAGMLSTEMEFMKVQFRRGVFFGHNLEISQT